MDAVPDVVVGAVADAGEICALMGSGVFSTFLKCANRIVGSLACMFHGNAFKSAEMGDWIFVRLSEEYRDIPTEENGNAAHSLLNLNACWLKQNRLLALARKQSFSDSRQTNHAIPHETYRLAHSIDAPTVSSVILSRTTRG